MLSVESILIFILLGIVVGLAAGLFGIGGGAIMVPILTTFFLMQGVPAEMVIHVALGTSMASIIGTSLSSLFAHHKRQSVIWPIVKSIAPGVILGSLLATYFVAHVSSKVLAIFFTCFISYVAVQMFLNFQPAPSRQIPGKVPIFFAGSGIGLISAIVAIGGGTLTVPFLAWHNIPLKKAIGTSAAVGFPIAVSGTIGYVINGWDVSDKQSYLYGFIYLPAVLLISLASYFTAPIGARWAHNLSVPTLKKVFALFLVLISIKMLWSVI
ncbi:MAG: sulfite exporter TauE/SafE family protein [Pseudomonadota bacterium]